MVGDRLLLLFSEISVQGWGGFPLDPVVQGECGTDNRRQGVGRLAIRAGTPGVDPSPTRQSALEREAIARAKRGDCDGLHYLYARYADEILGYVRSIVRDHHAAEDITQDIFARLMSA